jgi:S-formylglutathione hydrolase
MGGHGALSLAFKNPQRWKSVSAFSPICHPTNCPWGTKAFEGYLSGGVAEGARHDATCLAEAASKDGSLHTFPPVLVDQGLADSFFEPSEQNGPDGQLQPLKLEKALAAGGHPNFAVRLHEGYDHSYHFISTFMDEHINFHAKHLRNT